MIIFSAVYIGLYLISFCVCRPSKEITKLASLMDERSTPNTIFEAEGASIQPRNANYALYRASPGYGDSKLKVSITHRQNLGYLVVMSPDHQSMTVLVLLQNPDWNSVSREIDEMAYQSGYHMLLVLTGTVGSSGAKTDFNAMAGKKIYGTFKRWDDAINNPPTVGTRVDFELEMPYVVMEYQFSFGGRRGQCLLPAT